MNEISTIFQQSLSLQICQKANLFLQMQWGTSTAQHILATTYVCMSMCVLGV